MFVQFLLRLVKLTPKRATFTLEYLKLVFSDQSFKRNVYALYTADLKECDKITTCTYADDTAFVAKINSLQEVEAIRHDQLFSYEIGEEGVWQRSDPPNGKI